MQVGSLTGEIKRDGNLVGEISTVQNLVGELNNAIIELTPELEDLTVTPDIVEQNFKSNMYGYNNVKVEAIQGEDITIKPTMEEQKYNGVYRNVTVEPIESEEISITPSANEQTKEGLFDKVTVIGDDELVPENIKMGVEIFGVVGTMKEQTGVSTLEAPQCPQSSITGYKMADDGNVKLQFGSVSSSNYDSTHLIVRDGENGVSFPLNKDELIDLGSNPIEYTVPNTAGKDKHSFMVISKDKNGAYQTMPTSLNQLTSISTVTATGKYVEAILPSALQGTTALTAVTASNGGLYISCTSRNVANGLWLFDSETGTFEKVHNGSYNWTSLYEVDGLSLLISTSATDNVFKLNADKSITPILTTNTGMPSTTSRTMLVKTRSGMIFFGHNGRFYKYNEETETFSLIKAVTSYCDNIIEMPNGNVLLCYHNGSYYGSSLYEYDINTGSCSTITISSFKPYVLPSDTYWIDNNQFIFQGYLNGKYKLMRVTDKNTPVEYGTNTYRNRIYDGSSTAGYYNSKKHGHLCYYIGLYEADGTTINYNGLYKMDFSDLSIKELAFIGSGLSIRQIMELSDGKMYCTVYNSYMCYCDFENDTLVRITGASTNSTTRTVTWLELPNGNLLIDGLATNPSTGIINTTNVYTGITAFGKTLETTKIEEISDGVFALFTIGGSVTENCYTKVINTKNNTYNKILSNRYYKDENGRYLYVDYTTNASNYAGKNILKLNDDGTTSASAQTANLYLGNGLGVDSKKFTVSTYDENIGAIDGTYKVAAKTNNKINYYMFDTTSSNKRVLFSF